MSVADFIFQRRRPLEIPPPGSSDLGSLLLLHQEVGSMFSLPRSGRRGRGTLPFLRQGQTGIAASFSTSWDARPQNPTATLREIPVLRLATQAEVPADDQHQPPDTRVSALMRCLYLQLQSDCDCVRDSEWDLPTRVQATHGNMRIMIVFILSHQVGGTCYIAVNNGKSEENKHKKRKVSHLPAAATPAWLQSPRS